MLALATAAGPGVPPTAGAETPVAVSTPAVSASVPSGQLVAVIPFQQFQFRSELTLSLSVGPPGTVTTVTGRGFPGLQPVQLQWSMGVHYVTPPIVTQEDGTFATQFLVVFGDDVFGPRELLAAVVPFGIASRSIVVAQASFLVVPHTGRPPVADIIRALGGSRPFVFRH